MPVNDERQLIRSAMDRLLAGKPVRSTGALTVVALAQEAAVKRHVLTHRHVDLKIEFYSRVKAQGRIPQSEVDLRKKIADVQKLLATVRSERDALKLEVATLRRMVNVLAVEKARAEAAAEAVATGKVIAIHRG